MASAGAEESTASTDFRLARRVQRESAGGAKAIEHSPARMAFGAQDNSRAGRDRCRFSGRASDRRRASGRSSRSQRAREFRLSAPPFRAAGFPACERWHHCAPEFRRAQQFVKTMRDQIARAIHALVERLHHEIRAIAIDDQPRQQIALRRRPAERRSSLSTTRSRCAMACVRRRRKNAGRSAPIDWRAAARRSATWNCNARRPDAALADRPRDGFARLRASPRSVMSLEKIHGCPLAARSAALRFTLTDVQG